MPELILYIALIILTDNNDISEEAELLEDKFDQSFVEVSVD